MSDAPVGTPKPAPPVALITTLGVLAALAASGGLVGALLVLVAAKDHGPPTVETATIAVALFVGGGVLGCLLWILAQWVRRRGRVSLIPGGADGGERLPASAAGQARADQPPHEPPAPASVAASLSSAPAAAATEPVPASSPTPPPESVEQALLRDILAQLQQLNENILLSPEQREARRRLRDEKLSAWYCEQIDLAIGGERFARAETLLAEFTEKVPADKHHQPLGARLAEAREAAKRRDIESHTRRVTDLMAVSSFDQAEQVARELHERFPGERAVSELLVRVRRESKAFEAERRDRMYRQVQRFAESRRWRSALKAAGVFLEAYPDGPSTDAVRAMLSTLEDNARIEEARELRDHIRDLIERRRYAEAADVAEEVIRRFPDTRAAIELGRQLHRLRELARTPTTHRPNGHR